jgi:hypothetical protein
MMVSLAIIISPLGRAEEALASTVRASSVKRAKNPMLRVTHPDLDSSSRSFRPWSISTGFMKSNTMAVAAS